MENRETIRKELGVTQEAMAALLNITRSQWSMYEIGKRELPTSAMVLLAEMQLHMQSSQSMTSKSSEKPKTTLQERQQVLANLVLENQFQREKIAREIESIEKKQESHSNALQLVGHLESNSKFKTPILNAILKVIEFRAKKGLERHNSRKLTQLFIKQELLIQEESWLKEILKKG